MEDRNDLNKKPKELDKGQGETGQVPAIPIIQRHQKGEARNPGPRFPLAEAILLLLLFLSQGATAALFLSIAPLLPLRPRTLHSLGLSVRQRSVAV